MNRNHPFHDLLKPFGIRIDLHGKPVHDPCDQSVDKAHVLILLKKSIILQLPAQTYINPEKPDVPLNKNDAFQKVQKRRVQEKR